MLNTIRHLTALAVVSACAGCGDVEGPLVDPLLGTWRTTDLRACQANGTTVVSCFVTVSLYGDGRYEASRATVFSRTSARRPGCTESYVGGGTWTDVGPRGASGVINATKGPSITRRSNCANGDDIATGESTDGGGQFAFTYAFTGAEVAITFTGALITYSH